MRDAKNVIQTDGDERIESQQLLSRRRWCRLLSEALSVMYTSISVMETDKAHQKVDGG